MTYLSDQLIHIMEILDNTQNMLTKFNHEISNKNILSRAQLKQVSNCNV